jgi:hypothetical protein
VVWCAHHELVQLAAVVPGRGEAGVLGDDALRLRELRVDARELVHGRRDAEARHVRRQQLLVQRVRQYLRLGARRVRLRADANRRDRVLACPHVPLHGCRGGGGRGRRRRVRRSLQVQEIPVPVPHPGRRRASASSSRCSGRSVVRAEVRHGHLVREVPVERHGIQSTGLPKSTDRSCAVGLSR